MPIIDPPVAIASLSGESDATWASRVADFVGAAFIGAVALDTPTRTAARLAVERGRDEFLPPDPFSFVEEQLELLVDEPIQPGVNVRASAPDPIERAAGICADHGAIIEINAHCRQPECTDRGCGQSLLSHPEELCAQVSAAASTGAPVSVKVRTEVTGVDLPGLASALATAGADIIHVDAMDSRPIVRDIVDTTDAAVIANNNVRTAADVREFRSYGATAVSVGRASTDRRVLREVARAAGSAPLIV